MPLADEEILPLVHKRVRAEQRLAVSVQDAGRKAVVRGFDVAVAMIHADDLDPVHVFHFACSLLFSLL